MIFVQKALHSMSADQNRALGVALTAQWGKLVLGLLGEKWVLFTKDKKSHFRPEGFAYRMYSSKQSLDDASVQESLKHKIAIKFIQKEQVILQRLLAFKRLDTKRKRVYGHFSFPVLFQVSSLFAHGWRLVCQSQGLLNCVMLSLFFSLRTTGLAANRWGCTQKWHWRRNWLHVCM